MVELACGLAFSFQEAGCLRGGGLCLFRLPGRGCRKGFLYLVEEQGGLHRFGDIVVGSLFHRVHGVLHVGVAGHDHERGGEAVFLHPFEEREAVASRQPEVGEHKVVGSSLEQLACLGQVSGCDGQESLFAQPCLEQGGEGQVVFNDEDGCHVVI